MGISSETPIWCARRKGTNHYITKAGTNTKTPHTVGTIKKQNSIVGLPVSKTVILNRLAPFLTLSIRVVLSVLCGGHKKFPRTFI